MTQTQTKKQTPTEAKKQLKRARMRAVQTLYYDLRIVQEGEVFDFVGEKLPTEEIAIEVSAETPLGVQVVPNEPQNDAPIYTTKGFVDQANRAAGARQG